MTTPTEESGSEPNRFTWCCKVPERRMVYALQVDNWVQYWCDLHVTPEIRTEVLKRQNIILGEE
jgi:hypothetical protein